MSEYLLMDEPFKEWNASKMADYLKKKRLGDYAELFMQNNINGQVAHRLTEQTLKEMGVTKVGDRLELLEALEALKKAKNQQEREKVIWQGEEILYVSGCQKCLQTCCGCYPDDPSQYKLSSSHFEIKLVQPRRCGPCNLGCLGFKPTYHIDNLDFSNIVDADVKGIPPPCLQSCCCCAESLEHVHVQTTNEGTKTLVLKMGEGQKVSRMIKNQVEVMQRMERN